SQITTTVTSSEIQELTFGGTINAGGTFKITFGTNLTTAAIPYDPNPANVANNVSAIQSALNAILGSGTTNVVAPSNTVFDITFTGGLANGNMPQITTTNTLTGTSPTLNASTVREGAGNTVETIALGGTASGTFTPSYSGTAASSALTVTDEVQTMTLG